MYRKALHHRQLITLALFAFFSSATINLSIAADSTSPNFSILRGTVLSGGGISSSPGFSVTASTASTSQTGDASSSMFSVVKIFAALPDGDGDSVTDNLDDCTLVPNPTQRDTNGDGYGNLCDADLNNDGLINFADLGILKLRFGGTDVDADFNGDGLVNFGDLGIMKQQFGKAPGPSGLHP